MSFRAHHFDGHHLRAANVQPLRPPAPTGDDIARRAALLQAAASLVASEPKWAFTDAERLALLTERVGDVAAAFNRAHTDIEGELLKVMATSLAWLERLERERAR